MSLALTQTGAAVGGARAAAFEVAVFGAWPDALPRWRTLLARGAATPFQDEAWLTGWYAAHGQRENVAPAIVFVRDGSGADVVGLALALFRDDRGRRIAAFADGGVSDYNAPVVARGFAPDAPTCAALWRAVRRALPACDRIDLHKMPLAIEGVANPLAALSAARPASLSGNVLTLGERYDDYHWGLERTFRKELERSWRVFERNAGARFVRLRQGAEADALLAGMERLQRARIKDLGLDYVLDDPANAAIYRGLVARALDDGRAVLTALMVKDECVAALLSLTRGQRMAMVRLAQAGEAWKTCSPGRLVIERTMRALHAEGFREFDFTIGEYAYKRRMGTVATPLCEISAAMTWRGAPGVALAKAKAALRASPTAMRLVRRLRGAA